MINNLFPFKEWYEQTSQSYFADECPICKKISDMNIQSEVSKQWALFNTGYEVSHAQQAIDFVKAGGDIFEWSKKHWMFNYSDILPAFEYQGLMKGKPSMDRLVHIGCGALPFTGIFFSRYYDRVALIDLDEQACNLAMKLIEELNIKNVDVFHVNGKDFEMQASDTVLIASMVLDKKEIIYQASDCKVQDLLLRSTDGRARGIFYKKDHAVSRDANYDYINRTNPPKEIGNVTYHYRYI